MSDTCGMDSGYRRCNQLASQDVIAQQARQMNSHRKPFRSTSEH